MGHTFLCTSYTCIFLCNFDHSYHFIRRNNKIIQNYKLGYSKVHFTISLTVSHLITIY